MKLLLLLASALVLIQPLVVPQSEAASSSARLAAFRLAQRSGLDIPTSNVVVAIEPGTGFPHPPKTTLTAEQLKRDAESIAKAIGTGARAGKAADFS